MDCNAVSARYSLEDVKGGKKHHGQIGRDRTNYAYFCFWQANGFLDY